MSGWEYRKIDLNDVPPKATDIDVLNATGTDGWELVAITANNVAYLKRRLPEPPAAKTSRRKTASSSSDS